MADLRRTRRQEMLGRLERFVGEAEVYLYDAADMLGWSFQNLVNPPSRAANWLQWHIAQVRTSIVETVWPWAQNVGTRLSEMINETTAERNTARAGNCNNDAPSQLAQPAQPAQPQPEGPVPVNRSNLTDLDLLSLLSSDSAFDSLPVWVDEDNDEGNANINFDDDADDERNDNSLLRSQPSNFDGAQTALLTEENLSCFLAAIAEKDARDKAVSSAAANAASHGSSKDNNAGRSEYASTNYDPSSENNVAKNVASRTGENSHPARNPNYAQSWPPMPSRRSRQRMNQTLSKATTELGSQASVNGPTQLPSADPACSVGSVGSSAILVNPSDAESDEEDHYFVI
ncbi:hypothetical protein Sste5346_002836 [Sporothrix stenoceras]|uniref:Uncharacterized protein n=1 Tax=Sporothrix stenoceras TaxID=5173 RepID=A0ABR3ZGC5_9PEZI